MINIEVTQPKIIFLLAKASKLVHSHYNMRLVHSLSLKILNIWACHTVDCSGGQKTLMTTYLKYIMYIPCILVVNNVNDLTLPLVALVFWIRLWIFSLETVRVLCSILTRRTCNYLHKSMSLLTVVSLVKDLSEVFNRITETLDNYMSYLSLNLPIYQWLMRW